MAECPVIEADELEKRLGNSIIVDCRYSLSDPEYGLRAYLSGHIPGGAHFLDLEKDLSGPKGRHGGRHPLPPPEQFREVIERIGGTESSEYVAYDDDLTGASRFWFLCRYFGIRNVRVLNGGWEKWVREGRPVSTEVPSARRGHFQPHPAAGMVVDINWVRRMGRGYVLVDSRQRERYLGVHEAIDPKAGHIPGAVNIPYTAVTSGRGTLRPKEELEGVYRGLGGRPVVYCGSGVTACVNVLA